MKESLGKRNRSCVNKQPDRLFSMLEPRNLEIGVFYVDQKRCTTDCEDPKL